MSGTGSRSEEGYLLLADISGYTAFMTVVGEAHGVDFSAGIPPAFALMAALLDVVADNLTGRFSVAKLEGDAVFAVAPADMLDGHGTEVVGDLKRTYSRFLDVRGEASPAAHNHNCTACPLISNLDLKMFLHEGSFVHQEIYGRTELLGPAVNLVHRLLKNSIQAQVGHRHYLYLTDAAAARLRITDAGTGHVEEYADAGPVSGRVMDLASA